MQTTGKNYNYSGSFRKVEILSLSLFFSMSIWNSFWLVSNTTSNTLHILFMVLFASYIFSDFISGFVHWMADTWGSKDMPILGPTLVRSFREHHVDPMAITKHDFIETTGSHALISLPWQAAGVVLSFTHVLKTS